MGYFDNPLTGGIDEISGLGGGATGESERKRAKEIYQNMNRFGHEASQPGLDVMNEYYGKSFGESYDAAQNLDQTPGLESAYAALRSRIAAQNASTGMTGSGTAFAQNRLLTRQEAADRFRQALTARMAKQQAMAGLANASGNMGLRATQVRMQGQDAYAGARMNTANQQAADYAANQAGIGQIIGAGAQLAMAGMTGGTSLTPSAMSAGVPTSAPSGYQPYSIPKPATEEDALMNYYGY